MNLINMKKILWTMQALKRAQTDGISKAIYLETGLPIMHLAL
jgi:hypothetical protein